MQPSFNDHCVTFYPDLHNILELDFLRQESFVNLLSTFKFIDVLTLFQFDGVGGISEFRLSRFSMDLDLNIAISPRTIDQAVGISTSTSLHNDCVRRCL